MWLIVALVVLIVFWWIISYNKLVKMRNWVEEGWAQIDVQLKRRYDLIPNLVETVKGYATHEQSTLEKVIEARNKLFAGQLSRSDQMERNDELSSALKSVFALSESYPELKANENFRQLQEELTRTEDKVAFSRQNYNKCVMDYNTATQMFPTSLVASVHKFKPANMLEAKEEERENVKVQF